MCAIAQSPWVDGNVRKLNNLRERDAGRPGLPVGRVVQF
jgi:hypothetical protein